MLATPHRMNLNAVHRLRLVSVHVNRPFVSFGRDRSKPHCRLGVLNELLTLHNSINVYLQMRRNDLRGIPLRVINKVGHAWGVRMGTRPQYNKYSHVHNLDHSKARETQLSLPLAQDAQTAGFREKRVPCRSCDPVRHK